MALEASHAKDTQKSIGYIKSAIEQAPEDARMWYMLGTLYADIGLYNNAISNMEKALQLDKNYHIASFHLGLFYLMAGEQQKAEATWEVLNTLGQEHYLNLFKEGLLNIVHDNVQEGIDLIKNGINNNRINEGLNHDMQAAIDNASLSLAMEL
jgi:tetratricopeptide (TPR) repeat protein